MRVREFVFHPSFEKWMNDAQQIKEKEQGSPNLNPILTPSQLGLASSPKCA